MPRRRILSLAVTGLLAACAGTRSVPPAANRMQPDHLPTPYSAEQIRSRFARGGVIRMAVQETGQPARFEVIRFVARPNGGSHCTVTVQDAAGKPIGEKGSFDVDWRFLQSHASFPTARSSVRRAPVTTVLGTFDTWLYEVSGADDQSGQLSRYWFSVDHPGPPVTYARWVDGKQVFRATIVQHRP